MRKWVLVIVLLIVGCGSDKAPELTAKQVTEATTSDPATTVRAATSAAIVLKYDGVQDTAPFQLQGGRYRSRWETFDDCEYFGDLKPGNFPYVLRAASAVSGETFINNVKAGEYYVHMNTGPVPKCRWQITLERA
jgi:hypothetical protein